jgi:hypothetical protein
MAGMEPEIGRVGNQLYSWLILRIELVKAIKTIALRIPKDPRCLKPFGSTGPQLRKGTGLMDISYPVLIFII